MTDASVTRWTSKPAAVETDTESGALPHQVSGADWQSMLASRHGLTARLSNNSHINSSEDGLLRKSLAHTASFGVGSGHVEETVEEAPEQPDPLNPAHYKWLPSGVEVIDVTEWLPFNVGNVVKYALRSDHKNGAIEDLMKARWYLDREIARRRKMSGLED